MRRPYLILLLVLCGIPGGCDRHGKKQFADGKIADGIYSNQFFGFSIGIPEDMSGVIGEELEANVDYAISKLPEPQNGRQAGEAYDDHAGVLFRIADPDGPFNIGIVAENLRGSSIRNGRDYAAVMIKQFDLLDMNYSLNGAVSQATLGGRGFTKVPFLLANTPGELLYQDFYIAVKDGFALLLIASYGENEAERAGAIIKMIKFDK